MLMMLKLLPIINEAAAENSMQSNEVVQKMFKSSAGSLAKRLLTTKNWLLGVIFDNLNVKTTKSSSEEKNMFFQIIKKLDFGS